MPEGYDYSREVFHVGHLVPDIDLAMDQLGTALGLRWTPVVSRTDQPLWTPEGGQQTVWLKFCYSMEGPQRVELIEGPEGTPWYHGDARNLHHAGVWADVPALTNELLAQGWELVCAQKSPEEGYGSFTYVRSPTGFLLEPVAMVNKARMYRWFETGVLG